MMTTLEEEMRAPVAAVMEGVPNRDLLVLLERLGDGLVALDERLHVLYANARACELLGVAPDEIVGQRLLVVFPEFEYEAMTRWLHDPENRGGWTTLVMRDTEETVAIECTPVLLNEYGRPVVVLLRDVTAIRDFARAAALATRMATQYRQIFESAMDGVTVSTLDGVIVEANPAAYELHGYRREEFIGMHNSAIVHPDSWSAYLGHRRVVEEGGSYQYEVVAVRKDGRLIPVEAHGTAFLYNGELHRLCVFRDVTERVQAYELLERRVEERTRELQALLEVSHNIASTLELRPLLGLILDQLHAVMDYSDARVLVVDADAFTTVQVSGTEGVARYDEGPFHLAPDHPIWMTTRDGDPVIIDDVRTDDTELARVFRETVGPVLEREFRHVRSWMAVPLVHQGRVTGYLTFGHREPAFYTTHHAMLARSVGDQAAVAVENARLYRRAQELGVLEERQRLARELHDSVSQALYGIAVGAHTARTALDRDPTKLPETIDYILELARAGLAEMRALIFELRPETLATEGLVAGLGRQAAVLQARHGITVEVELGGEPDLPLAHKETLYRIAQEAMHNTVKHAQAGTVRLRVEQRDAEVELIIADDGVGFDPSASFPGHLGLSTMRERAARRGGQLEMRSAVGAGTTISVRLPTGGVWTT